MNNPNCDACGMLNSRGFCSLTACRFPNVNELGTWQERILVNKPKPSNADRIRAMSDEELAYFIAEPSVAPPPWCKEIPVCPHLDEDIVPCHECAINWLRQEANDTL